MIRLKNVSKFYYNKGVIASGFSKVNLEFKMGEFVAITGESGSGKSTLLNVISGLDSYEEGEMYINGEETSHYTEKDFENYRRKYIGNIFQNFNLVNSYTVYQNIELVLLLNGKKKSEIKNEIMELIKKVGLYKWRNTKVSKLSGGQKQRVAIARALAKDTPIIIADEPTGNLDSKSAADIIKLLSEISKNKLVIIVTHNYEQVEEYVTRKIKMHDGKVLEDKTIKKNEVKDITNISEYKDITLFNKFRLGIRNTFNIIPKFLLVFAVYLFITIALMSEYSSFKEDEYNVNKMGYNYNFNNTSDARIIIKKHDGTEILDDDYKKIESLNNIDYIVKSDNLLERYIGFSYNNIWLGGYFNSIDNFNEKLDFGKMPENENEIVIYGYKYDYYLSDMKDDILESEFEIEEFKDNINFKLKVVGIKYYDDANEFNYNNQIYAKNSLLEKINLLINYEKSNVNILFMNRYNRSNYYDSYFKLAANSKVADGLAYISSDENGSCPNFNCINQNLKIDVDNLYYKDSLDLKIGKVYNNKNMKSLLDISDYNENNGTIYISVNDYNKLFNKGEYQSSIFVSNVLNIDNTIKELDKLGFDTLRVSDTLVTTGILEMLQIFKLIVTVILVIALFFISYFIIRIILKSRNVYFSIIRMLGATRKTSKNLLIIELLTVSNLAYFVFLLLVYLTNINVLNIGVAKTIIKYLTFNEYILLYLILTGMSYLISVKYANKLFKKSTMSTFREEV